MKLTVVWLLLSTFFVSFASVSTSDTIAVSNAGWAIAALYKEDSSYRLWIAGTMLGKSDALDGISEVISQLPSNTSFTLDLSGNEGGSSYVARQTELLLREKCPFNQNPSGKSCQITTIVNPEENCFSACLNLFMIGDIRLAGIESKFGFHAENHPFFGILEEKTISDLLRGGVNPEWLKALADHGTFATRELTYFSGADLFEQNSNMVLGIVDGKLLITDEKEALKLDDPGFSLEQYIRDLLSF